MLPPPSYYQPNHRYESYVGRLTNGTCDTTVADRKRRIEDKLKVAIVKEDKS